MKTAKILGILALAFSLLGWTIEASKAAPIGTAFTYQGRLMDANGPADGLYDFQFKLFDDSNTVTGNQLGNTIDINDLDVIDGYFTVALDFGSGMFDGDARWLGIGVRPGDSNDGNDFVTLSPRTELTPVPYALHTRGIFVDSAGKVGIGTTSPEAKLSIQMPRGFLTKPSRVSGLVIKHDLLNSGSQLEVQDPDGNTRFVVDNTGNVGIGRTNPQDKLDVNGPINSDSVYKIAGSTVLSALGTDNTFVGIEAGANNSTGNNNTFLGSYAGNLNTEGERNTFLGNYSGSANTTGTANTFVGNMAGRTNNGWYNTFLGQEAGYSNTTGGSNTFLGTYAGRSNTTGMSNTFLGHYAGFSNKTGTGNVFIGRQAGLSETGSNKLYIANSNVNTIIYGDFSTGNVGIGTTSPTAKLEVNGEIKITDGSQAAGKVLTSDANGLASWQTPAAGDSDWIISGIDMYSGVSGNVGIGTPGIPGRKLAVLTSEPDGSAVTGSAYAGGDVKNYGGYFLASGDRGEGTHAEAVGVYGRGICAKGGLGGYAAEFLGNVIIKSRDGTTTLMQLGEGFDYAEGFDVSDKSKVSPGTVLIIDPENPGKLAVSRKAYDSKVAGIVAGAKGQGSGVRLGADQFDYDVALAGRVYCNVDATEVGVEPGDFLTTSGKPGYAMKAVDYMRAQGAILGKAMERLEQSQKGQILVLVTLQ